MVKGYSGWCLIILTQCYLDEINICTGGHLVKQIAIHGVGGLHPISSSPE